MSKLTVVMPTRDRPQYVAAQLRFFQACGLRHRIIVTDESGGAQAAKTREACAGIAEYHHFDPASHRSSWLRFADKSLRILRLINTPYVVMTPDDDITLPHALDAALSYLEDDKACIAARGYWLNFALHGGDFDIHKVASFTPSVAEDQPLRRLYHLMRRYQPFVWSVFRTENLAAALAASMTVDGVLFQEIMFMNAAILGGKAARLPTIFGLAGTAVSLTPSSEVHPRNWMLQDAEGFFRNYRRYRDVLARHARSLPIDIPDRFEQLLNVIHAIWLVPEFDGGVANHIAQQMLGCDVPPFDLAKPRTQPGYRPPETGDLVHASAVSGRRYIWRSTLVPDRLRDEIVIGAAEIARVESQLDHYQT